MKRNEFSALVSAYLEKCTEILVYKGNDYSGDEDVLKNFKVNGERLGLEPEKIWSVYFMKHIDAILTYTKTGTLASEPIHGRIQDAINYLLLFAAMVEEKGKGDVD